MLTSGIDFDLAERECVVVLHFDEEIAPWRGLRLAADHGGAAQRYGAGVVGAGLGLVHHRGLSGPRGHVGQSNGEVTATRSCKQVIITGLSFLLFLALPNCRSMA